MSPRTRSQKARARYRLTTPGWAIAALIALAAGTVALTVAAVAHGSPDQLASEGQATQPGFTPPAPATPSAPPTPSPTVTPSPSALALTPLPRAEERFLLIDATGTAWRGTAGSCATSAAPQVERSADGGATWTDVTPTYLGIRQLAGIIPLEPGQAQLIASTDTACSTVGLRTYTQGEFWEQYPDVLADASYLPPTDPTAVVTPFGAPPAPCAEPTSLSVSGPSAALICDQQPYVWSANLGDAWIGIPAAAPARAALVADDTLTIARSSAECTGLAISTTSVADRTSFSTTCRPDLDPSAPAVLTADPGGAVALWSGDALITF